MFLTLAILPSAFAGNPDRAGTSSGQQLLINPWARGSGLANAGTATLTGAEAIFSNVAGMAYTKKTELIFTSSNYLVGSGVKMNAFGFSQKVGESGVLGFSLQSFAFGDLEITTENNPDGGVGTYKPTSSNIGVSYAKSFSNTISGGITLRLISERTSNISGQGVAFDAGVRYVTGKDENIRIAISLRNVGPKLTFKGDALTSQVTVLNDPLSVSQIPDAFELPSLINIAGAYDFNFDEANKLTVHGNYSALSFGRDQYCGALEYTFKKRIALRGGYQVDSKNTSTFFDGTTNAVAGLAGGFSVILPVGKGTFSVDYGYKDTNPFSGIHSIGVRLNLE